MRILITGVTGFIGSSLAKRLLQLGLGEICGLMRFTSTTRHVPEGVRTFLGDLTDYYSVERVIKTVRPNVVIHLAALTPVSESFHQPRRYAEVNYIGTINLVEAIRRYCEDFRLFIYASTSEVYGDQTKFPLRENLTPKPNSPYAISKYAGELYVSVYARQAFNFPCVVARPFNTYGRAPVGQRHFVVEYLLTSMLEGREEVHLGDPTIRRDFLFREDHVNAYVTLLKQALDNEAIHGAVFNFTTGSDTSLKELVELCKELTGWEGKVRWYSRLRPTDIRRLYGSYEKAKMMLGWEPKYDLRTGLRKAMEEWAKALNI
ncbi:MAG: hypothetical protein DRP01_08880 [Archaeoglobales archaeon]|nr:MAG: hypothetical protein DRP01_08880 [Archaeoglobales archaeon]